MYFLPPSCCLYLQVQVACFFFLLFPPLYCLLQCLFIYSFFLLVFVADFKATIIVAALFFDSFRLGLLVALGY
jgi:hypothetical protein